MLLGHAERQMCKQLAKVLREETHYRPGSDQEAVFFWGAGGRHHFLKLVEMLVEKEDELVSLIAKLNYATARPFRSDDFGMHYSMARETLNDDTIDMVCEQAGKDVAMCLRQQWDREAKKE